MNVFQRIFHEHEIELGRIKLNVVKHSRFDAELVNFPRHFDGGSIRFNAHHVRAKIAQPDQQIARSAAYLQDARVRRQSFHERFRFAIMQAFQD